jgi:hypothetical protein
VLSCGVKDTGGTYVQEFPAMMEVSLSSADAVLLGQYSLYTEKINSFIDRIPTFLNVETVMGSYVDVPNSFGTSSFGWR